MEYIVFLRGINVSGQKLIRMEDLKMMLHDVGFHEPKTYIQSGNIWLKSDLSDAGSVASVIYSAILERFGFDVPTLALSHDRICGIIDKNPFLHEGVDEKRLYYTLLSEFPDDSRKDALLRLESENDELTIDGKTVYIRVKDKYSDSRLSNNFVEKTLKVKATTRNHATMMKMAYHK